MNDNKTAELAKFQWADAATWERMNENKTAAKTEQGNINVRFLCGHFEKLNRAALDTLAACEPFKINGALRSEAGEYCLSCSTIN